MVNSSINSLRARKRRGKLETPMGPCDNPEECSLSDERHRLFLEALTQLSAQHRAVLTLREVRGFSYPEIARMLQLPEGTVKSALNRGRSRLLEVMERQGHLQEVA
jgi:RNA polymerase sigma-70 factor (ECF subfamily)